MKRNVLYTLSCLILLLTVVSCGRDGIRYRIGVSQCSNDDWRRKMNDEINREIMFHPEAEVEIRSADDSNEKQISDIRYFMDNDFDIIIAAPNEADAITPVVREAYESGIPVIVFDRNIHGDTYTANHGVDNVGIGKSAACYAYSLVGRGGKILEIYGLRGSTPAIDRHNGFVEEAEKYGLDIIGTAYGSWNYNDAAKAADSMLVLYPDADLIYAHNDRMAIAASEVAKNRGADLKIIGIDAAPEIGIKAVSEGVIDATFLYPTEGYRLVRTALAILEDKPYVRNICLPASSAVDKSNADILLMQNESLKEETEKIKLLKSQVDDYWSRHSAQTTLFYAAVAIVILLFGFIFVILRSFWLHKRHQAELIEQNRLLAQQRDTEKSLNEQLNAATQSKLMFFTNVSHDLRTPLTLIAEPVEQLARADYLTPQHRTLMKIADRNVRILRRLINQILDFRKYENGKLQVTLSEVRIADLLKEWSESFTAITRKKHIKMIVDISTESSFTMAVDVEKIERVFFNLMSNAFKYTPENGRICFTCSNNADSLTLTVEDNGQGIAAEDLDNIFMRFYQADRVHSNGSGIGLSLAKAFVELHGGQISVESEIGRGSKFKVCLPIRHVEAEGNSDPVSNPITCNDIDSEFEDIETDVPAPDADKPLLLVIDDNSDIRRMIRELMKDEYTFIEAHDGKTGIRMASKYVPDLIICDVMMPVMDGFECCRRIKEELSTSHIPVLMLTACGMDEQRTRGYESGADGYLAKPFSNDMLRMRCRNLIENRKRILDATAGAKEISYATQSIDRKLPTADIDNEFYARFVDMVSREMGNAQLNIDSIAVSLGIGRSQFYRKIKSLTNYSPVELLRKLRLSKARELLTSGTKSISEIAYEVGFSTPAYFTKVFRETFGETPSEMRERLGHKN